MTERESSSRAAGIRGKRWALLALFAILAAGCSTVGLQVSQPVGAEVELYQKGKWFSSFGPDWGTRWHKVSVQSVDADTNPVLELEARDGWLGRTFTAFPRRYRARFDLSSIDLYPGTSQNLVEVWRVREVVPPEHQRTVDLWQQGRTLDALVRLPLPAFADVLYSMGHRFENLCREVPSDRLREARAMYDEWATTYLETSQSPSPISYEIMLKYLFNPQQLDRLLSWADRGVTLRETRWTGRDSWGLLRLIPFPRTYRTRINIYEDVVLRHLLERKVERTLVHAPTFEVFAEVRTFDTSYFSDRVLPEINLIQGQPKPVSVQVPELADVDELLRTGHTRPLLVDGVSIAAYQQDRATLVQMGSPDQQARAMSFEEAHAGEAESDPVTLTYEEKVEALRSGLPLPKDVSLDVTSLHSQVLGAVLSNQLAYIVIWRSPREVDTSQFLTTVVTVEPEGMARVWAIRNNRVLRTARGAFPDGRAPAANVVRFVGRTLGGLFHRSERPVAVFAFGNRELAPWTDIDREPVDRVDLIREFKALSESN